MILALNDPGFRYYIVITPEDKYGDYRMLAKDFELPCDEKPTNKVKVGQIYKAMKKRKWFDFDPHPEVGFIILDELSAMIFAGIYTIPSFEK